LAYLTGVLLVACSAKDRGKNGGGAEEEPTVVDGGGGCTPGQMTMTGQLVGRYGVLPVNVASQSYLLQVNEWGAMAPQTMAYGGDFFFKMTQQDASTATNGGPTGFPSLFIGANSGHSTPNSNLPKQVSALTSVPTTWNWKDNGTLADTSTNSYNATYDVWFSTQPQGEPRGSAPSGGYLMVWLYDPPDAQPIGTVVYNGVKVAGVPGTWDVWIGPNGTRPTISYVRTTPTSSMSYDLNLFIQDAVNNRHDASGKPTIQSGWYLTNVFVGFEIWRGGVGLETTSFCATVP
jgi:hypothetical protein